MLSQKSTGVRVRAALAIRLAPSGIAAADLSPQSKSPWIRGAGGGCHSDGGNQHAGSETGAPVAGKAILDGLYAGDSRKRGLCAGSYREGAAKWGSGGLTRRCDIRFLTFGCRQF